jgi:hypothetical protein
MIRILRVWFGSLYTQMSLADHSVRSSEPKIPLTLIYSSNRSTPITCPSAAVFNLPFDWSRITITLPNGSRSRAHNPIAISKGGDLQVDDEFRIGIGEGEPRGVLVPPQQWMTEPIMIEGDGRVEIADAQQMIVQLAEQSFCHHLSLSVSVPCRWQSRVGRGWQE